MWMLVEHKTTKGTKGTSVDVSVIKVAIKRINVSRRTFKIADFIKKRRTRYYVRSRF
jgi:hypothetical protein